MSPELSQSAKPTLARRIGLFQLVFYGLGTVLGAGIYVLVGKVALSAGMLVPVAFLVAALVAWVTALSYSQLVALLPLSGGEAAYVEAAFGKVWLTQLTGALVIFVGVVSAATLSLGFIGYLNEFVPVSRPLGVLVVLTLLGVLACWGIRQAVWVLVLMTALELGGLLWIIAWSGDALAQLPQHAATLFVPTSLTQWLAVISGAFLAFYAFIGFEDMVNVAEEVVRPERTMPRAILIVIVTSTLLYILVAAIAVLALPLEVIQQSDAPMSDVLRIHNPDAARWIAAISVVAILNGVLAQIIMAARVLYGMAAQGRLPALWARINARTHTPIVATVTVLLVMLVAALLLPLETLARATSFIVLLVFSLVNEALIAVKQKQVIADEVRVPHWPWLGLVLCLALLVGEVVVMVA